MRWIQWNYGIKRPPVPQPAASSDVPDPSTVDHVAPISPARTKPPSDTELDALHQDAQLDFVNQAGFGYVKDRDHVAGFESHGFFRTPELRKSRDPVRWITRRVELVSILLHDVPMVYVSENLPNMQELGDVEVRPLDAFETQSLDALRDGEDLVWRVTANRLRMLGSLRAARQCAQCHMVPRGTLLGAFSYEFHRDPLLPVEQAEESVEAF